MSSNDRYRLGPPIARGRVSEVFLAELAGPDGFNRRVVIKRPRADVTDPAVLQAFVEEATIAGRFHHPGVAAVLDVGHDRGRPYLVLEYVEGEDLGRTLDRATNFAPTEVALFIVAEVAAALHYVHSLTDDDQRRLGVVHRDVSPDNIVVANDGHVKLVDFGTAHAVRKRAKTEVGIAKGTLGFMAPEQARGDVVDPRADLFGLGCLLQALMTGESPTESLSLEHLAAGMPPKISPTLPTEVQEIVERCLRTDPARRFRSAEDVASACEGAASVQGPISARRAVARWVGRAKIAPEESTVLGDFSVIDRTELVADSRIAPPNEPDDEEPTKPPEDFDGDDTKAETVPPTEPIAVDAELGLRRAETLRPTRHPNVSGPVLVVLGVVIGIVIATSLAILLA